MSRSIETVHPPRLALGVAPVGEMQGAGTQESAWLIQRNDRFMVVSELVYRFIQECDGSRSADELAAKLTETTPWAVTAEDVRTLVQRKLAPMGLVEGEGSRGNGEAAEPEARRSALQVNLRRKLLGPEAAHSIARAFSFLYWPPIIAVILAAIAFAHVWLYFLHGPTASITEVLGQPALFLVVVASLLAAAVFHELGHAAALARGGGRVRGMGFGFYLIFPALYTDVTDAYRLPRTARIRTDLGGPYFHLLASLVVVAVYLSTRAEFLLLIAVLIDVEVLRQFVPFLRLDGYWLLVDATGVPDFFSQMGRYLKRFVPRLRDQQADALPRFRPAVRAVFVAYAVLTFVALPALLLIIISRVPQILSLAWASFRKYGDALISSLEGEEWVSASAHLVQALLLGLQVAGIVVFFYLVAWRPVQRLWQAAAKLPEARLRWMMRTALAAGVAGMTMIVAALLPWRVVGPLLARSESGLSFGSGRIVLACGVGLALAGPVLLFGGQAVRRAVAVMVLMVGVAGALVAFDHLARTRTQLDQAIRSSIARTTDREPTPQQQSEVRQVIDQFGISVHPGAGSYVAMLAGGVAVAGGTGGLVTSMAFRTGRGGSGIS